MKVLNYVSCRKYENIDGSFLGIYSIAPSFMTQESVSQCGSITTKKQIVRLFCWNVRGQGLGPKLLG